MTINSTKKMLKFKPLMLLWAVVIMSVLNFSFTERVGVRFMNWSFSEVTHQAKARKKPIFVFIWSNTCMQSKRMDDVFKMSKVTNFYNDRFICNKYETERLNNRVQAIKWGVKGYPSFAFFSTDGKLLLLEEGYHKFDETLAMGERALEKIAEDNAKHPAMPKDYEKNWDKYIPEAEDVDKE